MKSSTNRHLLVVIVILLSCTGQIGQAKDLSNRLGVGYKNQFVNDIPSVAAQYYPSADMGFSAALGVDTQQNLSKFGFEAKVYRVIFTEQNMNFYMGAGAGLISNQTTSSTTDSGFELNGFVGGEFFLPGLDSLGFTFEAGVGISSMSSGVRFKTLAIHPFVAELSSIFKFQKTIAFSTNC